MKGKGVDVKSYIGTINMCLALLYDALKNGEDIEDDIILCNSAYFIENCTNITIDYLKELISSEMNEIVIKFNKEALIKDCMEMSVPDVAKKYGKTEASIYSFCLRNHINYKKINRSDTTNLIDTINNFDGKLTLDQMAKLTHHSWSFMRNFCMENNLAYKGRSY